MNNDSNSSDNNITLADVRTHAGWAGKVYLDTPDGVIVEGTLFWLDGGELFATCVESAECTSVETAGQLETLI